MCVSGQNFPVWLLTGYSDISVHGASGRKRRTAASRLHQQSADSVDMAGKGVGGGVQKLRSKSLDSKSLVVSQSAGGLLSVVAARGKMAPLGSWTAVTEGVTGELAGVRQWL